MGLSGPLIFVALFLSEKVGLGIAFPGVLDEPALMSTANLFRLAQRRLSAGSNPFEGKLFYVNPSYRRPQLDTVGYSWEVDRSDRCDRCARCDRCDGLMLKCLELQRGQLDCLGGRSIDSTTGKSFGWLQ